MKNQLIVALILLSIVGCKPSNKTKDETTNTKVVKEVNKSELMDDSEQIAEKYWKLITLEGKEVGMVENQEQEIYFILKTNNNSIKGFAGCNTFNGSYELKKGNRIKFIQMATTLKLCADVAVNESEIMTVFELADNYTINDDVLSLNVGRRAPLAVFEAVYF